MRKVSIQMCCFNGETHLAKAIESIILQTYSNWELIFWDNCSTDNSAAIVKSYSDPRIKYYKAPFHTDLGGGRAASWPLLTGDLIAFLDVDDTWEPNKIEKQAMVFEDPNVAMVIGDVMWMNDHYTKLLYNGNYPPEGLITGALLRKYFLSLPSVMISRSKADSASIRFDPRFSHNADYDLFLRISTTGNLKIIKEHLASWRVDMKSQSWKQRSKFEKEHFYWIELYKRTTWFKNHPFSFLYFQIMTIAKKLYFSLLNDSYEKYPSTGMLNILDKFGFISFLIAKATRVDQLIKKHNRKRLSKWISKD